MTLDKFTIKAQEAVQEAVNTAQRGGQLLSTTCCRSWVLMLSRLTCWYSQSCSICPK